MQYVKVGIVGGSDLVKICEQLGSSGQLAQLKELKPDLAVQTAP